jgi:septal ring factor EnvC (AmiA/AmiB activator)
MRNSISSLIALFLIAGIVAAQEKRTPCAEAELRATMLESRLAAERLRSETSAARTDSLTLELDKQTKGADQRIGALEQRLASEQKATAVLVFANDAAKRKIAELESQLLERDRTIAAREAAVLAMSADRDKALRQARRANKQTLIAVFAAIAAGIVGVFK